MHISSSYAKILGEKLFRTWEILRSGSKAEDGEKKERKKERGAKVGNNGQATHGARKQAWRTQAAWANYPYYPICMTAPIIPHHMAELCLPRRMVWKGVIWK